MERRAALHGLRQVQDEVLLPGGAPRFLNSFAQFHAEIQIRIRKFFRRKFVGNFAPETGFFQILDHQFCAVNCHLDHFVMSFAEDDLAVQIAGCHVKMQDRILLPLQGFNGAFDEVFPCLSQHGNTDAFRDQFPFDQPAYKVEIILRRRWKRDFDFFKPHVAKKLEIFQLFLRIHGQRKSLVAIPQIYGTPGGRLREFTVDPFPLVQRDPLRSHILRKSRIHHSFLGMDFFVPFSLSCCLGFNL